MPTLIKFDYENHRGEDHNYLVRIGRTSLQFQAAVTPAKDEPFEAWHLTGEVLQRDDEDRPGFRSFQLAKIRNLQEVADS